MIQSMTGYGKTSFLLKEKKICIEIKCLNSKQLDVSCRIMPLFRSFEIEIRKQINQLIRGKIDLSIYEEKQDEGAFSLNKDAILSYYKSLQLIAHEAGANTEGLFAAILKLPEATSYSQPETNEEEMRLLSHQLEEVICQVVHFRQEEGKILSEDIQMRIDAIRKKANSLYSFEGLRIEETKKRLKKSLSELDGIQIDANRFEQELIYYLEKFDITEEKVRLQKHLDYFSQCINEKESQGKKLSFICQEINREINTMGSKSNQVEMQTLVVEMKDELEKIKEQLGNIL